MQPLVILKSFWSFISLKEMSKKLIFSTQEPPLVPEAQGTSDVLSGRVQHPYSQAPKVLPTTTTIPSQLPDHRGGEEMEREIVWGNNDSIPIQEKCVE